MISERNHVKELIEASEIDSIVKYCKKLTVPQAAQMKQQLIDEMKYTQNKGHRNTIAIVLSDLKCNEAIPAMVELINNPENKNCIGTLLYALENLDCENEIKNIIHILMDGNYEAQYCTYSLLLEKHHKMKKKDRKACKKYIKEKKRELKEALDLLKMVKKYL